jgi:hypothetical protein
MYIGLKVQTEGTALFGNFDQFHYWSESNHISIQYMISPGSDFHSGTESEVRMSIFHLCCMLEPDLCELQCKKIDSDIANVTTTKTILTTVRE